jgi:N-acetylglucosaminyl-diphospho-decaprenol L-rhamnosyltransferase
LTLKHNISLVLVTFNSEDIIKNFLLQAPLRYYKNITIVDNASSDATVSIIQKNRGDVQLIKLKQNIGFGSAVNIGLASNSSMYSLVINPDTFLSTLFFDELSLGMLRHPDAGLIAPTILSDNHFSTSPNSDFTRQENHQLHKSDLPADFISGACFLIKPDLFAERKIFDENIFMFYEDNDLSRQIEKKHLKKIILKDCFIYHQGEGSSTPSHHITALKNFHYGWSESYFNAKHNLPGVARRKNLLSILNYFKRVIIFSLILNKKRIIPSWFRLKGKISFMLGQKAQDIRESL